MSAPLLEMQGVVKEFPGVRALDGVDLDVVAGEVHCLLGQNGAGKSTLIKVLAGAHQPDEGHIAWEGEPVTLPTPTAAMRHGIATIYQELDLADGLSVAENIYLGHERSRLGFTQRSRMHDAARQLLRRLGHPEIPVTREVGQLSAAGKQLVSMARALSHDARLIIMDEPSAVLAHDEVDNLFRIIGDLTAAGVAVVYISHRMEEIRRIGDRVTVLKDGRTVARGLPARTTPTSELVSLMTGRTVEYVFPPRPESPGSDERPVLLEVEHISRPGEFDDISFTVRAGEIVGLAGLVGSGRSEILETVYGARRPASGRISVAGSALRPGSVTAAVRAGLGLAPEERKSQALFMQSSIAHNVSMSSLRRFARAGFLDSRGELAATTEAVRSLDLRPPDPTRPVRTLSGGNQQKAVVARWLLKDCRLLLLDEPTRGVDVGARAELYTLIRRLADSGVGVLLVSSEVPEVLGLADRVLVMREGRVVREAAALDLDESKVLDLVMEGSSA
ncbi:sugar ABC transporter ATP-binding protein [Streptomyces sp. NPDC052107]|uniref:sugar ABC transporter ATP-binding protein n=1 Tax=Streptomyces sp. NPDC052107 TaxID=3155632 RepID=UPI0034348D3A